MRPLKFTLVALFLATSAAAFDHRSDVSERISAITGQRLNPDVTVGRAFSLPPGITSVSPLTEKDAVAIALWNSPGLEVILSELDLARADLAEAGILVNPNFNLLFGIGVKPWEFLLNMPIQALWQRPRRVAAAKLNLEMISEGLVQNGLDLVRDTRIAHGEVVAAQRIAALDAQAKELLAEIADLTEKQEAAGDISGLQARLVRLEAINSANRAARSAKDLELARESLRVFMGATDQLTDLTVTPERQLDDVQLELNQLVMEALSSRPDLRAAELGVRAAGERAGWEHSRVFNLVAAQLSSKEVGTFGLKTGPGLSIEIPIFDRNQGGISRAEAQLRRATLQYLELAMQVKSEVRKSRLNVLQAREQLELLRAGFLPGLRKTLELVENAYANGDISYLELRAAQRPLLDALRSEENVLRDHRRAMAELERAIGRKL